MRTFSVAKHRAHIKSVLSRQVGFFFSLFLTVKKLIVDIFVGLCEVLGFASSYKLAVTIHTTFNGR